MIDLSRLKPGLRGQVELVVGEEHTAPRVGSGRVHVLATPVMINLIEAAALEAAENLLPPGHKASAFASTCVISLQPRWACGSPRARNW